MTVLISENADPSVVRVFVVRHGQTDHNVKKILQGHIDVDLNDTGREQAHLVARTFANINLDHIVTSDLVRCQNTVKPFLEHRKLTPKVTANLRERDMGKVQGMYLHDARAKYGDDFRSICEADEPFLERVDLEWRLLTKQPELLNVALFSHGGVITAYVNHLHRTGYKLSENLSPSKLRVPYNTSVTVIDIERATGKGTIQIFGNTDHLGAQLEVKDQLLR